MYCILDLTPSTHTNAPKIAFCSETGRRRIHFTHTSSGIDIYEGKLVEMGARLWRQKANKLEICCHCHIPYHHHCRTSSSAPPPPSRINAVEILPSRRMLQLNLHVVVEHCGPQHIHMHNFVYK